MTQFVAGVVTEVRLSNDSLYVNAAELTLMSACAGNATSKPVVTSSVLIMGMALVG